MQILASSAQTWLMATLTARLSGSLALPGWRALMTFLWPWRYCLLTLFPSGLTPLHPELGEAAARWHRTSETIPWRWMTGLITTWSRSWRHCCSGSLWRISGGQKVLTTWQMPRSPLWSRRLRFSMWTAYSPGNRWTLTTWKTHSYRRLTRQSTWGWSAL